MARKGIPHRRLRDVLSDDDIELVKELLWNGFTHISIAKAFSIDEWTVERIKKSCDAPSSYHENRIHSVAMSKNIAPFLQSYFSSL